MPLVIKVKTKEINIKNGEKEFEQDVVNSNSKLSNYVR